MIVQKPSPAIPPMSCPLPPNGFLFPGQNIQWKAIESASTSDRAALQEQFTVLRAGVSQLANDFSIHDLRTLSPLIIDMHAKLLTVSAELGRLTNNSLGCVERIFIQCSNTQLGRKLYRRLLVSAVDRCRHEECFARTGGALTSYLLAKGFEGTTAVPSVATGRRLFPVLEVRVRTEEVSPDGRPWVERIRVLLKSFEGRMSSSLQFASVVLVPALPLLEHMRETASRNNDRGTLHQLSLWDETIVQLACGECVAGPHPDALPLLEAALHRALRNDQKDLVLAAYLQGAFARLMNAPSKRAHSHAAESLTTTVERAMAHEATAAGRRRCFKVILDAISAYRRTLGAGPADRGYFLASALMAVEKAWDNHCCGLRRFDPRLMRLLERADQTTTIAVWRLEMYSYLCERVRKGAVSSMDWRNVSSSRNRCLLHFAGFSRLESISDAMERSFSRLRRRSILALPPLLEVRASLESTRGQLLAGATFWFAAADGYRGLQKDNLRLSRQEIATAEYRCTLEGQKLVTGADAIAWTWLRRGRAAFGVAAHSRERRDIRTWLGHARRSFERCVERTRDTPGDKAARLNEAGRSWIERVDRAAGGVPEQARRTDR